MRSSQNFPTYFTQDDDDKGKYYNHHIQLQHNPYEQLISGDIKKPIELPFRIDETNIIKALQGGMSWNKINEKIQETKDKVKKVGIKDEISTKINTGKKNNVENISSNINQNISENSNILININSNIPTSKITEKIYSVKKKKEVKEISQKNREEIQNFLKISSQKIDDLCQSNRGLSTQPAQSKKNIRKSTSKNRSIKRTSNAPIHAKKNNIKEEDEDDDEENCFEEALTQNTCYKTQLPNLKIIAKQLPKTKSKTKVPTKIVSIGKLCESEEGMEIKIYNAKIKSLRGEVMLLTNDELEPGKTYRLKLNYIGEDHIKRDFYSVIINEGEVRN